MDITAYREEIRLRLTGGLLDLELDDVTIDRIIQSCLREIQRYICSTKLITIPFSKCIDLSQIKDEDDKFIKISSVVRIYRALGFTADSGESYTTSPVDPMQASQWQLISGTGNMAGFQDYVYNYGAYSTLLQIRNTTSTDLAFRYDKASNKLYINISSNTPAKITVEYIPRYDNVDEITSDYWIDVLTRMCVATAKITVGRIRSRYTQSNAIWNQDGNTILEEGNSELNTLREQLQRDTQLCYGID